MSDSSRTFLGSTAFSATLLAAALAICGYFFQQGFEAISQLQRAETQLSASLLTLKERFDEVAVRLGTLQRLVTEIDRRVTRREDNRFTAQEGMKMQIQIAEHSTLLAQQSQTLADVRGELRSIRDGVQKVWSAVRHSEPMPSR